MKKKKFVYFLLTFLGCVILIGVLAYKNFYYDEKESTSKNINTYLKETKYQQQVLKKEFVRDSTTGEYFAKITFKDEPNNEYEIYESGSNNFKVYGYKDGVEIVDKDEGKYITEH